MIGWSHWLVPVVIGDKNFCGWVLELVELDCRRFCGFNFSFFPMKLLVICMWLLRPCFVRCLEKKYHFLEHLMLPRVPMHSWRAQQGRERRCVCFVPHWRGDRVLSLQQTPTQGGDSVVKTTLHHPKTCSSQSYPPYSMRLALTVSSNKLSVSWRQRSTGFAFFSQLKNLKFGSNTPATTTQDTSGFPLF